MKGIKESQIQKAILEYLAARHIFAIRLNSGMQFGERNGKKYAVRMSAAGTANILAFPHQYRTCRDCMEYERDATDILWLKVKAEKGKQSELQKSFQAQVEREGHRYAIVRSIEDVKQALGTSVAPNRRIYPV